MFMFTWKAADRVGIRLAVDCDTKIDFWEPI